MSEWIKVKDRLPENQDCYLVYVKCSDGGAITILYYREENEFTKLGNITHWMPLPAAPK